MYRQMRTVAGSTKRGAASLCRTTAEATRRWLAQYIPAKPIVIQFPVNDICNSRCVMCNIWQKKRDHEMTCEELVGVLRDPLFSNVNFVGLNGGEPTLRKDLPELAGVLVRELPKLREMHIITNAIRHGDVIDRILAVNQVAVDGDKKLSVSVSLDGVGQDHDHNRGVQGNFESAVKVIDTLREQAVPFSIGCTLTTLNCYGADDLLQWCHDHHISQWEFRLGVEIKRVYNEGFNLLHPITPQQRFHLTMFFDKLARHEQAGLAQRRFYRSLVDQIAFGSPRTAGCHWQTQGVTLDTRGNISYCSVQSPILGSALTDSAQKIFKKGLPHRRKIIKHDCASCQHDLLGPPPIRSMIQQGLAELAEPWQSKFRQWRNRIVEPQLSTFTPSKIQPATRPHPSHWRHVVITGWYGTETQGDKAILGELVHFLKTHTPARRITLTTIDRKVSEQTRREIPELADIEIVDLIGAERTANFEQADALILGGGPLEDIGEMEYVWRLFNRANQCKKSRVIFGCGVGPFHHDRVKAQASAILRMATAGFFRDKESHQLAVRLGASEKLAIGCDPALRYLHRWAQNRADRTSQPRYFSGQGSKPRCIGLLRANTCEYVAELSSDALQGRNDDVARQLASVLESVAERHDTKVDLLPMHTLWMGGDDRMYNRQIAQVFRDSDRVSVDRKYLTLSELLESIEGADLGIVMRYHGHLFCMALGVPIYSIDYTGQRGKVSSLIDRMGYGQWSQPWQQIEPMQAVDRISELLAHRQQWSNYLQNQTLDLVVQLEKAYEESFDVRVLPQPSRPTVLRERIAA